ncbi:hypothetical protein DFS34DRAFT_654353 [Phlyctochytrium arcticum]|nr:hypothetical protein DFS34DRAFT_654353 [Phlyctochytrium arcticum]
MTIRAGGEVVQKIDNYPAYLNIVCKNLPVGQKKLLDQLSGYSNTTVTMNMHPWIGFFHSNNDSFFHVWSLPKQALEISITLADPATMFTSLKTPDEIEADMEAAFEKIRAMKYKGTGPRFHKFKNLNSIPVVGLVVFGNRLESVVTTRRGNVILCEAEASTVLVTSRETFTNISDVLSRLLWVKELCRQSEHGFNPEHGIEPLPCVPTPIKEIPGRRTRKTVGQCPSSPQSPCLGREK